MVKYIAFTTDNPQATLTICDDTDTLEGLLFAFLRCLHVAGYKDVTSVAAELSDGKVIWDNPF